ncbi:MAG TPA: hypothetical protein VGI39_31915, partial [Polyangiaceae bacterium]
AANHLAFDLDVPAVLGLGGGAEAVKIAGSVLVPRGVLAIATFTKNPLVTRLPQPSGPRLVWRTTYDGDQAATASARILHETLEPKDAARTRATRVVLARSDDAVGASFGEAFFRSLQFNGKPAVDNGSAYREVTFAPRDPSDEELRALVRTIADHEPTHMVLAGAESVTVPLVRALEAAWPRGGARPVYVAASDSTESFAPLLGTSAERRHRFFAVQSVSNSLVNARFVVRYNQAHPKAPVTRQINPSAEYDAVYLLAYAAFALGDAPVTGASLAKAFERLLPPGNPIEVGPTDLPAAVAQLTAGKKLDLIGAETALDLSPATGEGPADFALLCPAIDRRGRASGEDVESGVLYRAATRTVEGVPECP